MSELTERTFAGRFDQIRLICEFILQGAAAAGFGDKARFQVELACDEACTNIIEHAYGGEGVGAIRAGWRIDGTRFVIQLHDHGQAFDPAAIKPPPMAVGPTNPDDIKTGGLGMHFMRTVMDDLDYRFDAEEGNTLIMSKQLPRTEESPVWDRALAHAHLIGAQGRLDHENVPLLERTLLDVIDGGRNWLIVDLSRVTYINSGGLRALVTAWRRVRGEHGNLVVAGLGDKLLDIFRMIGFDRVFQLYTSVEAAQAALRREQA